MAADKLGGRVYHHIGSVLNGTYQIRRAKRVVYDDYGAVAMGNLADAVNIGHARIGIAKGLYHHSLGVVLKSSLYLIEV